MAVAPCLALAYVHRRVDHRYGEHLRCRKETAKDAHEDYQAFSRLGLAVKRSLFPTWILSGNIVHQGKASNLRPQLMDRPPRYVRHDIGNSLRDMTVNR